MARTLRTIEQQHADIDACFSRVSDPEADHRDALNELTQRLAAHVSVEQSVLLPAMKKAKFGSQDVWRELRSDYRCIGRLLVRIERRKIDSPDLPSLVTNLLEAFNRHVRHCTSFSTFEDRLSSDDLQDLSSRLERAQEVIMSHPHPHLLALGPISRLTTRLAARFDRVRDRTVSNLP